MGTLRRQLRAALRSPAPSVAPEHALWEGAFGSLPWPSDPTQPEILEEAP